MNNHTDFQSEDARLFANTLIKNYASIYESHFCENEVVDAIMYNKNIYASNHGIKLTHNLLVPKEIPLSSIDLISIYSNLLDNAIDYCIKLPSDKKIIDIQSYLKAGYLIVKVSNCRMETTPFHLDEVKTSKEDKENHGLGLSIIRYTCEKNHGMLSVREQNHMIEFQATCQLKKNTQNK